MACVSFRYTEAMGETVAAFFLFNTNVNWILRRFMVHSYDIIQLEHAWNNNFGSALAYVRLVLLLYKKKWNI